MSARAKRLRADGVRSRQAILVAATQLATVEGLDGLSIGRLAEHIGMSKSGVYAHFGSKQDLQLAAIEAAGAVFEEDVVRPALAAPEGEARVVALGEAFLSHVERNVFPGGCFFASVAAEVDTHPGPVRDRIAAFQRGWLGLFEQCVREAQALGEIDPGADPAQLVFELNAFLGAANSTYLMQGDAGALDRARSALRARLGRAAGSGATAHHAVPVEQR